MMNKKPKNHTAFEITGSLYSYISMGMIICVFAFIIIVTFNYGWGVLSFSFLTTEPNPSALDAASGGILTPIIGTLILTIVGIITAFPFALATSIYLCFYAKKGIFKNLVKSAVDILSGVPTIVIALFVLAISTLPAMGFLSSTVDTRTNTLDGAMLNFKLEDSFIDVVFDEGLEPGMSSDLYAGTVKGAFDDALANSGLTEKDVVMVVEGSKITLKVGEGANGPLLFFNSSQEDLPEILGLRLNDEIAPGNELELVVDAGKIYRGTMRSYGRSFLVAAIAMSIMILPFVIKSMEESLKSVPASYIDASRALGATKWNTIYKVVLKAARDGLITGVILGMGRIVGDTAIVWLTLGGSIRMTGNQPWFLPENWMSTLKNSGCTLTSYIYYTSPAGEGNQFDVAFGASLVLIALIILLNIAASAIGKAGHLKHV
jgi:ABC-type phosphate transport system permease subunit